MTLVLDGVGVSNGLGWSPDERTMYFIDTATEEIRSYPFDLQSGRVGEPSTLAVIEKGAGFPDGMCTDNEGCLWVALWGGGCVRRYAPDGRLDTVVKGARKIYDELLLWWSHLDHLYITTARRDLEGDTLSDQRLAGSVWAVRPGVTGPPATPWMEIVEHR